MNLFQYFVDVDGERFDSSLAAFVTGGFFGSFFGHFEYRIKANKYRIKKKES